MLAVTPVTITGPAIENIFTHSPKISPSFLKSSAGLAIEFENPVIGIMLPAPANAPMRSYTPIPVSNDARKIKITSIYACMSSFESEGNIAKSPSKMPCPMQHISPPTRKAHIIDGKYFVFGSLFSTNFE